MEELGYKTEPMYNEERADIVQNIEFGNPDDLIKYCQGIRWTNISIWKVRCFKSCREFVKK